MLATAFYFELAINWTPGHDCFPLTVSLFPCSIYYFLSILFHFWRRRLFYPFIFSFYQGRRIRAFAVAFIDRRWCGLWDARHSRCGLWRAPVLLRLLLHPFSNGTEDRTRPRLLLHPFLINADDRTRYACCCILSIIGIDRTRGYACCCILSNATYFLI